jgi:hypothetical protein
MFEFRRALRIRLGRLGHIHSFGLGYPGIYFRNYMIILTKICPRTSRCVVPGMTSGAHYVNITYPTV